MEEAPASRARAQTLWRAVSRREKAPPKKTEDGIGGQRDSNADWGEGKAVSWGRYKLLNEGGGVESTYVDVKKDGMRRRERKEEKKGRRKTYISHHTHSHQTQRSWCSLPLFREDPERGEDKTFCSVFSWSIPILRAIESIVDT